LIIEVLWNSQILSILNVPIADSIAFNDPISLAQTFALYARVILVISFQNMRTAKDTDKPEGRDARKEIS
jgi:hypothetical protein